MDKSIFFKLSATTLIYILCVGCHSHSHHHDNDHEEDINPNIVHMGKAMQETIGLETEAVAEEPIGTVIRTVAQVQPTLGNEQVLTAKADGVVTLCNSSLTDGSSVRRGQAICTINASVTAQGNLAVEQQQARLELERTKKEYERLNALRADKLALESDVANAKAAYEQAQAAAKGLQQGFAAGKQTVCATEGGYMKQLHVQNGEFVQTGQPIATITQTSTLQLKAEVQADYYPMMNDISSVNLRSLNACNDEKKTWTLEELEGKLLSYGHQTNAECPLIPVVFQINNVGNFLPGTYVELYIRTRSKQEKMTIAESALLEEMGSYYVFVQTEKDHFERRLVIPGITDGIRTEIKSGLQPGEKVVTHGAMQVKMQQAVGSVDAHAGHNH